MKAVTTISLDPQLKRFAQQANINISNLTNNILKSMMNRELAGSENNLRKIREKIKCLDTELDKLQEERAELHVQMVAIEENTKIEEQKQLDRLDIIEKSIKNAGMLRKTI